MPGSKVNPEGRKSPAESLPANKDLIDETVDSKQKASNTKILEMLIKLRD